MKNCQKNQDNDNNRVDRTAIYGETFFFQEIFIMDNSEFKQMLDDIIVKLDELLELISNLSAGREQFL